MVSVNTLAKLKWGCNSVIQAPQELEFELSQVGGVFHKVFSFTSTSRKQVWALRNHFPVKSQLEKTTSSFSRKKVASSGMMFYAEI